MNGMVSFTKGNLTLNEIEFIQAATIRVLVAVSKGEVDLNTIAREELCARGYDQDGLWVGARRALESLQQTQAPPTATTEGSA